MTTPRRIALAAASACLTLGSVAHALTYDEVESELRRSGASWLAEPSRLPTDARASVLRPQDVEESETESLRAALRAHEAPEDGGEAGELPASLDWRDAAGVDYMTKVSAQGGCGACVSFAAVSTVEAQIKITCGTGGRDLALSRQYVHSCGGGDCKAGWKLSEAVDFLVTNGVPDAACLPYGAGEGRDIQCSEACTDVGQRMISGLSVTRPTTGVIDVLQIKRALLRGPLLSSIILFEDLEYYGRGVYRHAAGRQLGSHAIVLVGWSDEGRAWIARNSWGEEWGESGYFEVAWDDRSLPGRYTWAFDVAAGCVTR